MHTQPTAKNRLLRKLASLLFAATVCLATTSAQGDLLDFKDLGLNNNDAIPLSYGDTPQVDVSHRVRNVFTNGAVIHNSLFYWDVGYGDLTDVAWSVSNNANHVEEVRINSNSPWGMVTLDSFELAGWQSDQAGKDIRIYDENWNLLGSYSNQTISGATHNTYFPALRSSSLIIQWEYPWAVGIDNINFTATIPEPSSVLLGGILVCAIAFQRRNRLRYLTR